MRELLMWSIVVFFSLYAMKNWFAPVPVLILLMPLYGNPDMPASIAGIQGLNPWNILTLTTLLCYFAQKRKDESYWDMDRRTTILFLIYFGAMMISGFRLIADQGTLLLYGYKAGTGSLISEFILNPVKFFIPGFLIFTGARTEMRRKIILWSIIASHLIIAMIVIRNIPLSAVTNADDLTQIGLKVLEKKFSWSKVNTAMLLGCGAWAVLFSTYFLFGKKHRYLCLGLFVLMTIALALTGGRMGYAVWGILGVFFAVTRWKKGLIILPVITLFILAVLPSVSDRLLQGTSSSGTSITIEDSSTVTSGRTVAWPVVLDRISQAPMLGFGGMAMIRTGATAEVNEINQTPEGARGFPHPHNAYLLLFLDTGLLGGVPILLLWATVFTRSIKLCGERGSESDAIGITSLCLALGLCLAGLGSQTFYPVHGAIALWASIGLTFRLYIDKVGSKVTKAAN